MTQFERSAQDARDLKARLKLLHAFADEVAEIIERLPDPETFLDGERAARVLIVADRIVCRLPENVPDNTRDVPPARQRLRNAADRLLSLVTVLPQPQTHLEAERAGRFILTAERLFTRLYTPPAPLDASFERDDEDRPDTETDTCGDNGFRELLLRLNRMTDHHARAVGYWMTGEPFAEVRREGPDWITDSDRAILDQIGTPFLQRYARIATTRASAITEAAARATGWWPDGQAYRIDAPRPDYWVVSPRFEEKVMDGPPHVPAPGTYEIACNHGYPWWVVHVAHKPVEDDTS